MLNSSLYKTIFVVVFALIIFRVRTKCINTVVLHYPAKAYKNVFQILVCAGVDYFDISIM